MATKVTAIDSYRNRFNRNISKLNTKPIHLSIGGGSGFPGFNSGAGAAPTPQITNNPSNPANLPGYKPLLTPQATDFKTNPVPVGDKSIYGGSYSLLSSVDQMGESALNRSQAEVQAENRRRQANNSLLSQQAQYGGESLFGDGSGLDADQLQYANMIASIGRSRGLNDDDITIALMTALAESGLRNLNYGDRDSVGLFQQRTSQGWGTIQQIMDPTYSINKFYDAYMPARGSHANPWQVAQNVQRSAFADGSNYRAQYERARQILASARNGGGGSVQSVNAASSFINAYNNRYIDFDGSFGNQCVDLFNYYNQSFVGGGFIGGVMGAKDLWYNRQMDQNYRRISASARPNMGDVVVYGGVQGGGYGHVAIVVGMNADGSLRLLHSNATSAGSRGNTVISNLSRHGVLGYFRPNRLA